MRKTLPGYDAAQDKECKEDDTYTIGVIVVCILILIPIAWLIWEMTR